MRKQRAFTGLKEEEIEQIAGWLRHSTYDQVRERLAKPRPEGFGLELKSTRPLETLYAKSNQVDRINHKIQTGQKLTLADFDAINAGERAELPEQIHDAILETTCQIVMEEDNTPTQLLALQRLADFPARADYRQHKIQMDLHRKEMAEHRKHNSEERLALAKRSLELRDRLAKLKEEQLALKKGSAPVPGAVPGLARQGSSSFAVPSSPTGTNRPRRSDHLGFLATTPEEIRARAIAQAGFDAEELARKAQERAKAASLPSEKAPLINAGIHAGASTPTLSPASVSTLSETQEKEPTIHRSNNPKIQLYEPFETNIIQNRMPGPA